MAAKRVFVPPLPQSPLYRYLREVLPLAEGMTRADAVALPVLAAQTADALLDGLERGLAVYLPVESLPEWLAPALRAGLAALGRRGLTVCTLADLPHWVETGVSCPALLTAERLNAYAARGIDRVYLAGNPAATPLARRAARTRGIQLTGGMCRGTGKSHRLSLVYPQE